MSTYVLGFIFDGEFEKNIDLSIFQNSLFADFFHPLEIVVARNEVLKNCSGSRVEFKYIFSFSRKSFLWNSIKDETLIKPFGAGSIKN